MSIYGLLLPFLEFWTSQKNNVLPPKSIVSCDYWKFVCYNTTNETNNTFFLFNADILQVVIVGNKFEKITNECP